MKKNQQGIDLLRLVKYLLRFWPLFLLSVIIAFFLTRIYHGYQVPVYSLNTSLLIEDKTTNILLPDGTTSIFNSKAIDNEIAMLQSLSQIREIFNRLNFDVSYYAEGEMHMREIYRQAPFMVKFDSTAWQSYEQVIQITVLDEEKFMIEGAGIPEHRGNLYTFGKQFIGAGFDFTVYRDSVTPINPGRYSFIIHNRENLVSQYRNKIVMNLERGTSLLRISTSGTNVEKEKDFLNKLAQVYIQSNLERKNQIANNTISFIDDQLFQIRASLDDVENSLTNFRQDNKLMKLTDKAVPILKRVDNLEKNKADQMLDLKYYEYLRDYLLNHQEYDDIVAPSTVGISLPLFSDLLLKLSTTYLEKENLIKNSTRDNPYVKTLEIEIANQKRVLLENITDVIETSKMKIRDYDRRISEQLQEFGKLPELERKFVEIDRLYKLNSEMYTFMLKKRSEAEISKATHVADLKLVDKAGDTGISFIYPNTRSNYIRAIIIALILPGLILIGLFLLNNKVNSRSDIEILTTCPVVETLPNIQLDQGRPINNLRSSDYVQSVQRLRASIPHDSRYIGITSTIFGEGKSTLALNLAVALHKNQKQVLLVNFDQHSNGLGSYIDQGGLTKAHSQNSEQIMKIEPGFDILFFRKDETSNFSGLAGPDPWHILDQCKDSYDHILFDTPPAGLTFEALELAEKLDRLFYVIRHNVTPGNFLSETLEKLATRKPTNEINIVYNDVPARSKISSYHYFLEKANRRGLSRLAFRIRYSLSFRG